MLKQFLIVLATVLTVAGAVPTLAPAAQPRASLPDIEDEVMCPACGTPLALSGSPQAERERNFIRQQIAAGKTKGEIKQALVNEYGRSVLALPRGEGFDLAAYLVPVGAVLAAATAIGFGLARWRRRGPPATGDGAAADLSPTDASRLDQDLSRYDL